MRRTVAVVLAALSLSACGSVATVTTTTTPTRQPAFAVWPYAPSGVRDVTAVAAARTFASQMLHMDSPTTGRFHRLSGRRGTVAVWPEGDGVATTVRVEQTPDGNWWVLGSSCVEAAITSPVSGVSVTSPLTLSGRGLGFEGVLNVQLYADGASSPIATGVVEAGSTSIMNFHGSLAFARPMAANGTLVVLSKTARDGSTVAASVVRVRFPSSS